MEIKNDRTIEWHGYLWRVAGLLLALLLLLGGYFTDRSGLILLGLLLIAAFGLLLVLALWGESRLASPGGPAIVDTLYRLSQTRPSDSLLVVDLGRRWPALFISRNLTSGHAHVVDIYNPQLTPAASLARQRKNAPNTRADPRLIWYDSTLQLLPLPDASINAVFLYSVLSELAQDGDRRALLKEVTRVLAPGGRLLLAEPANSWPNRLRPGARRLHTTAFWQQQLTDAGFAIQRTLVSGDVAICIRADKPSPFAGRQMQLELGYRDNHS
ncbi:MAG: class I SAM-dependent methyltransferase [Candidatus Promineifilaceae bacterium]